jgi:hypothetical protein
VLLHPPYSPDLTSTEFGLSDPLKDKPKGHHYLYNEALQNTVEQWPQSRYNSFYRLKHMFFVKGGRMLLKRTVN